MGSQGGWSVGGESTRRPSWSGFTIKRNKWFILNGCGTGSVRVLGSALHGERRAERIISFRSTSAVPRRTTLHATCQGAPYSPILPIGPFRSQKTIVGSHSRHRNWVHKKPSDNGRARWRCTPSTLNVAAHRAGARHRPERRPARRESPGRAEPRPERRARPRRSGSRVRRPHRPRRLGGPGWRR